MSTTAQVLCEVSRRIKELQQKPASSKLSDQCEMKTLMQQYEDAVLKLRQENESFAGVESPRSTAELKQQARLVSETLEDDANKALQCTRIAERDAVLKCRRAAAAVSVSGPETDVVAARARRVVVERDLKSLSGCTRLRLETEKICNTLKQKHRAVLWRESARLRKQEEVALLKEAALQLQRQKTELS